MKAASKTVMQKMFESFNYKDIALFLSFLMKMISEIQEKATKSNTHIKGISLFLVPCKAALIWYANTKMVLILS